MDRNVVSDDPNMNNNRIAWVDVLRCLGMLAIFCGHMGHDTRIFNFVFYYHVSLFFFISGMFAVDPGRYSFKQALGKHVKNILVPYVFLCVINMIVLLFAEGLDFWTFIKWTKQLVFGIRNQMPVATLWFFSCLFVMSVLFDIIHYVFKNKYIVLLLCICLYVLSITVFPNRPDAQPSWIFNIDSACMYILYYAIGFSLKDILFEFGNKQGKQNTVFYLTTLILSGYTFLVYTDHDKLLEMLVYVAPSLYDYVAAPLRAILLILFNICIAKILSDSSGMSFAGRNSLWLCGNEAIARRIILLVISIFGGAVSCDNEFAVLLYGIVMIIVIMKVIYPVENYLYQKVLHIFSSDLS